MKRSFDRTDLWTGIFFIAVGLAFGAQALGLEIGTARRMGAGYFPMVLSGILIGIGVYVALRSLRITSDDMGGWAWRGMIFILPAPVVFGLTVRGLGFVPALFITALLASFASRKMTVPVALILAATVTVMATLIFSYGLELPYRRFGPWLRF